jgi:serine/threonine protein kinase
MLSELKNEVEIYDSLSDLQGKATPTLVHYGYWEGGMFCLGFSLCGNVPTRLSDSQKQKLLDYIDAIHTRGILHNDIRKENILVDDNGQVYLIDFAFATRDSDPYAQEKERKMLLRCISDLQ